METLIILGKGPSRHRVNDCLGRYPGAKLWTLNNFFPAGEDPGCYGFDLAGSTDLHFDVHYDQRFWSEIPKVPSRWIVSPFLEAQGPRIQPFPLAEVFAEFGHAYFECSLCYMAALAALEDRFERVCLPGVDMEDPTHFSYRFGLHFWLGVLAGRGVQLEIPPESAALQRRAGARALDTETEFPHIYGQPWSVTEPHAARFGWRG